MASLETCFHGTFGLRYWLIYDASSGLGSQLWVLIRHPFAVRCCKKMPSNCFSLSVSDYFSHQPSGILRLLHRNQLFSWSDIPESQIAIIVLTWEKEEPRVIMVWFWEIFRYWARFSTALKQWTVKCYFQCTCSHSLLYLIVIFLSLLLLSNHYPQNTSFLAVTASVQDKKSKLVADSRYIVLYTVDI